MRQNSVAMQWHDLMVTDQDPFHHQDWHLPLNQVQFMLGLFHNLFETMMTEEDPFQVRQPVPLSEVVRDIVRRENHSRHSKRGQRMTGPDRHSPKVFS